MEIEASIHYVPNAKPKGSLLGLGKKKKKIMATTFPLQSPRAVHTLRLEQNYINLK